MPPRETELNENTRAFIEIAHRFLGLSPEETQALFDALREKLHPLGPDWTLPDKATIQQVIEDLPPQDAAPAEVTVLALPIQPNQGCLFAAVHHPSRALFGCLEAEATTGTAVNFLEQLKALLPAPDVTFSIQDETADHSLTNAFRMLQLDYRHDNGSDGAKAAAARLMWTFTNFCNSRLQKFLNHFNHHFRIEGKTPQERLSACFDHPVAASSDTANPGTAPPEKGKIERLVQSVNDNSRMVRQLFILLAITTGYLSITVGATTDLMILKNELADLPLFNVKIPLNTFYFFAPWLYFFFHLNFLLHTGRLLRSSEQLAPLFQQLDPATLKEHCAHLHQFGVLLLKLRCSIDKPVENRLIKVIMLSAIALFPPLVLYFMFLKMAAQQDFFYMASTALALLADIGALLWLGHHYLHRNPLTFLNRTISRIRCWLYRHCQKTKKTGSKPLSPVIPLFKTGWNSGHASILATLFLMALALMVSRILWGHLDLQGATIIANDVEAKHLNRLEECYPDLASRESKNQNDERHEKLCSEENLDESKLNIRGMDFRSRSLEEAVFDDAKLFKADFSPSRKCIKENNNQPGKADPAPQAGNPLIKIECQTEAKGSSWIRAVVIDADFRFAHLSAANFKGANLANSDFSVTNLTSTIFTLSNLTEANLSYADLSNADLSNADLSNADLSNADLTLATLGQADEEKRTRTGAPNLGDAENLAGIKLRGTENRKIDLRYLDMRGWKLPRADLSHADLSHADLSNADLTLATLGLADEKTGTRIGAPDLNKAASLAGIKLRGTQDRKIDLRFLDLCGWPIDGGDFSHADFTGARVPVFAFSRTGVKVEGSRLPEGLFACGEAETSPSAARSPSSAQGKRVEVGHSPSSTAGAGGNGALLRLTEPPLILPGAIFSGSSFAGRAFGAGTDFSGARLVDMDLGDSWFQAVNLEETRFENPAFNATLFRDMDLGRTTFSALEKSWLDGVTLNTGRIDSRRLDSVVWRNGRLQGSGGEFTIERSLLLGVRITGDLDRLRAPGSLLCGLDLSQAKIGKADFSSALLWNVTLPCKGRDECEKWGNWKGAVTRELKDREGALLEAFQGVASDPERFWENIQSPPPGDATSSDEAHSPGNPCRALAEKLMPPENPAPTLGRFDRRWQLAREAVRNWSRVSMEEKLAERQPQPSGSTGSGDGSLAGLPDTSGIRIQGIHENLPAEPEVPLPADENRNELTAGITARLPYDTLRQMVEKAAPREMRGEQSNVSDTLAGDKLSWVIRRGGIDLKHRGDRLDFSTNLNADLRLKWEIRALFTITNVTKGKVSASLEGSTAPRLNADWSVDPRLSLRSKVHQATVNLAGVSIGVARHIQPQLDRLTRDLQGQLNGQLKRTLALRDKIEPNWRALCRTETFKIKLKDGSEKPLHLTIRPQQVRVQESPRYGSDALDWPAAFTLSLSLSHERPASACPPLPPPQLVNKLQQENRVTVRMRLSLPTGWIRPFELDGIEVTDIEGTKDGYLAFVLRRGEGRLKMAVRPIIEKGELIRLEPRFAEGTPDDLKKKITNFLDEQLAHVRGRLLQIDPRDIERNVRNRLEGSDIPLKLESVTLQGIHPRPGLLHIDLEIQGRSTPLQVRL